MFLSVVLNYDGTYFSLGICFFVPVDYKKQWDGWEEWAVFLIIILSVST